MTEIQVIARYTVSAANEAALIDAVSRFAAAVRAEPGNLGFEVYRNIRDARQIVLLERYASVDAIAAHRDSEHYRRIVMQEIVPLLDSRVVQVFPGPDGDAS